jgi:UDP-glucose-4-epimerase GalE
VHVLVTGGAGYIGSHTVRRLLDRGDRVTVVDSLERGRADAVGAARLVVADVRDEARLLAALRGVDAVVHFAALKSVAESVADPGRYFACNVGGTLAVLRAMQAAAVPILVHSSTCAVYGPPDRLPVGEEAELRPANPYGESKLLAERLIPWFGPASGTPLRAGVLRYFNAAGAADDGTNGEDWRDAHNLVPIVLRVAAGLLPAVEVYGTDYPTADGTAIRDYVHVEDLAAAHLAALDRLVAGGPSFTVNVGTGRGASVLEVLEAARRITGRSIPARLAGRRPGDPPAIWAGTDRSRQLLGWSAERDLEAILASAWRWHTSPAGGAATR